MFEIILIITSIIYLVAHVNEVNYLLKIYNIDMAKLKDDNKREVGRVRSELYKNNSFRYTPESAEGIIGFVKISGQKRIGKKRLKFQHDLVKSFFVAIDRHLSG